MPLYDGTINNIITIIIFRYSKINIGIFHYTSYLPADKVNVILICGQKGYEIFYEKI